VICYRRFNGTEYIFITPAFREKPALKLAACAKKKYPKTLSMAEPCAVKKAQTNSKYLKTAKVYLILGLVLK
jgi:hypothetical protein